ncbi:hypothetical protein L1887_38510 [Cichorium endivia]|nr:hypothetical protein L1887_38510 [Cichorium endivia]
MKAAMMVPNEGSQITSSSATGFNINIRFISDGVPDYSLCLHLFTPSDFYCYPTNISDFSSSPNVTDYQNLLSLIGNQPTSPSAYAFSPFAMICSQFHISDFIFFYLQIHSFSFPFTHSSPKPSEMFSSPPDSRTNDVVVPFLFESK